jgi:hypothetical protein
MTPAAHTIRIALNDAMEAQALGDAEAQRLYNPDPDINSLAERLLQLRAHNVPEPHLQAIFTDLRAVIQLNTAQTSHDAAVSGQLDELATSLHRDTTQATVTRALGIHALARALRPALAVLQAPASHSASEYVRAVRDIDRIITTTPRSRLLSHSVRHELGATKHALLTELVEAA